MEDLTADEKELMKIGSEVGKEVCSLYKDDYKRPPPEYNYAQRVNKDITSRPPFKPLQPTKLYYHQLDSLAETEKTLSSIGFMKNITEYKRNYFQQHNVENSISCLHDNIEKLFNDIKDFALMPKQQLVKSPYASMNLDSMPLLTKKVLLKKYYSSVKTYYMEDPSLFKFKLQPVGSLKTLQDIYNEKERIVVKNTTSQVPTCDEIETIARIFNKYHSDIKQISDLQSEIMRLLTQVKRQTMSEEIKKKEELINEKIKRNSLLLKENKLRIPFKKDLGFTGYEPHEAIHSEEKSSSKYPLYLTMNGLLEEQFRRRTSLEKFNTEALKYHKECSNPKKVPVCFQNNSQT